MQTFQYIKGASVPNATGYKLFKKSGSTYTELEAQTILKQLVIGGTIGSNGQPAELPLVFDNLAQNIMPITKYTTNGYVYYVHIKGDFSVDSYEYGVIAGIPFSGTLYVDSPDEFEMQVGGMKTKKNGDKNDICLTVTYKKTGSNTTKSVDIVVYSGIDYVPISVGVTAGTLTVYAAHAGYFRTDFIPIEDLTDHLRDPDFDPDNPKFYCVGAFKDDGNLMPGYKIAFYEGMSYSTFIKGLKWKDFNKGCLTVSELKTLKDTHAPNAKYVIFSSSPTNSAAYENSDFVSLGSIHFMLTGNEKLSGGEELYVKAIGDGKFFADSDYSVTKDGKPIIYNPVS